MWVQAMPISRLQNFSSYCSKVMLSFPIQYFSFLSKPFWTCKHLVKKFSRLGVTVHACNPSTQRLRQGDPTYAIY